MTPVSPEEIRARAASAGITIAEDRIAAFTVSVAELRPALAPLRVDLAARPVEASFGGHGG